MGQSAPRGHQHDLKKLSGGFAATLSWTNKNSVHKRHTHTHTRTRARARPAPPPLPWRRRRGWIFLFFFFCQIQNQYQQMWDKNFDRRMGIYSYVLVFVWISSNPPPFPPPSPWPLASPDSIITSGRRLASLLFGRRWGREGRKEERKRGRDGGRESGG